MSDREGRIVTALNTSYLGEEALQDAARLGVELRDGALLTVCDYDTDDNGDPLWLAVEGVAAVDHARTAWRIEDTMEDVRWEPRSP